MDNAGRALFAKQILDKRYPEIEAARLKFNELRKELIECPRADKKKAIELVHVFLNSAAFGGDMLGAAMRELRRCATDRTYGDQVQGVAALAVAEVMKDALDKMLGTNFSTSVRIDTDPPEAKQ